MSHAKTQSRQGRNFYTPIEGKRNDARSFVLQSEWRSPHKEFKMTENELARIIVDAAYRIHTKLGPGLLESVYEIVLEYELSQLGLKVNKQVPVSVQYDAIHIPNAFRADMDVENLVLLELKSVECILPVHQKQLLTYLRLSKRKLGLLINFGAPLIKNGIRRVANGLEEATLLPGPTTSLP
jgi:GxxExxY protein